MCVCSCECVAVYLWSYTTFRKDTNVSCHLCSGSFHSVLCDCNSCTMEWHCYGCPIRHKYICASTFISVCNLAIYLTKYSFAACIVTKYTIPISKCLCSFIWCEYHFVLSLPFLSFIIINSACLTVIIRQHLLLYKLCWNIYCHWVFVSQ